jgi:hypothetical protein
MHRWGRFLAPLVFVLALCTTARADALPTPAANPAVAHPVAAHPVVAAMPPAASPGTGAVPLDVPTQQQAIRKLDFMVGFWAGSGWIIDSTGVRRDFRQTEWVRYQVDQTVISVEGEGRDPAVLRRVVDSALAVINFNDTTSTYRWEAFSQGHVTTSTPVVGANSFQWTLPAGPSATIRYSLTFTTNTWHEIGEITTDGGTTWHQNFQMDLVRIH